METKQKENSWPIETSMEWPCTSRSKVDRTRKSGRDGKGYRTYKVQNRRLR